MCPLGVALRLTSSWRKLGMGGNLKVLETMHSVYDRYGACSGGSRNIAGHNSFAISLERTLAQLYSKQAALCFGSGYNANDCALTVLGSQLPDCVFLSDASNHGSTIGGIRHSRARKLVWKHNDLGDLEERLASIPRGVPKVICFESVYSMSGKQHSCLCHISYTVSPANPL